MNSQQLKDLAKQAGFITYAGPDIHVPEDPYGDGCAAELAKFAEQLTKLVVEEGIRYFNEDYRRDFDVKWHDDLSAKLSDHFKLGTNLV